MKNKLILLLAILFGSIAAFGAFQYTKSVEDAYQLSGNHTQVATVRETVPSQTLIQSEMLEFIEVPVEYVMPEAVLDPADAVGKMARSDIFPGEQLLAQKLMDRDDQRSGLAVKVEDGKRAVTIPVGLVSSLHGLLNVSDRVDVMVTFGYDEEESDPETGDQENKGFVVTSTVIHNTPILAVNARTQRENVEGEEISTITVMVSPEDAQLIVLATQQGTVQLALRSPDDQSVTVIPMVGVEDFLRY